MDVGGSTVDLFNKKGTLLQGRHKLHIWPGMVADGGIYTTTPHKYGKKTEMDRVEHVRLFFLPLVNLFSYAVVEEV